MKFTVDDFMRHAFALVTNDDEYCRLCKRIWYAGFDQMPRKYCGLYPKVLVDRGGYINCCLSHFSIINMARTMGWDHVTILEADAFPMKDCMKQLSWLLDEKGVPDDADEISFGNIHFIRDWTNKNRGEKCLVDVDKDERFGHIKDDLWGTHAVVIFARGYDTWLNNYLNQKEQIGPDFYRWLTPNCYATTRSYFLQVKDTLQYPDRLCDPDWLDDFPEIAP